MSATVPVNWQGCKVNNETDLAIIDNKKTRSTPVPFTFPNGRPCPIGTQIDRYGRYVVPGIMPSGGVNMQADGEPLSVLYMPSSAVQAALTHEQGQTLLQRDMTLREYNTFIRDYVPGLNPGDDAIAQDWANRAAAVNYSFTTEYAPGKFGTTTYNYSAVTVDNVKADAAQINLARYNTSMHQF